MLENGDMVMSFPGTSTHHFLACNAQGEPLYRTSIPAPAGYRSISLAARPGGGFFAVAVVVDSLYGLAWQPDSIVGTFELYGFSDAGAMDLRRQFTTRFATDSYDNQVENIACDGSGIYITVNRGNQATDQLRVLHTTLDGDLLWAKSYVIEGDGVPSFEQNYKLGMDGTGGLYFVRKMQFNPTVIIGRIDSDGSLLWLKSIAYTQGFGFTLGDLVVRPDGTPVVVGSLNGAGMYAVAPDGSSVQGHIYTLPEGIDPFLSVASASPDGSLLAVSRLMGTIAGLRRAVILNVGSDFELINVRGTDIVTAGQTEHGLRAYTIAHAGSNAVILGNRFSQDTVFQSYSWHPTLWNVDLASDEGCMLTDPQVTHFTVPQDLITFEDRNILPISDIDVLWTPLAPEWSTEAPFTTSELCSLLVGTPEHEGSPMGMVLYPNPGSPDGVINLSCADAARFTVYSATGATLLKLTSARGLTTSFSSAGLAPGLYPVVAFGSNGQRIAVSKLEVR